MITPPRLRPGSRVALVAPAGPVDDTMIATALDRCRRLDLEPVPGTAIRRRAGYLAGDDGERAADLAAALTEPGIDAVWALRGGYGSMRTLEHVDLSPLRERPRAFIGFSDNTVVHLALLRLGVTSFHGPHAGYAHFPPTTEAAFRRVLMEPGAAGALPPSPGHAPTALVAGMAEGPLVGGNLALLAATCGTPYQLRAPGGILFLEDVGEPLYRIDRMLVQLRLAGVLDEVAGVALGEFVDTEPDGYGAGGPSLADVLEGQLRPLGVPVVLGLPFGHGEENWTLPLGVRARLDAGAGTVELLEPATTEGKG